MSQCEFSGLKPVVKNLVSHSNIKTKSRAFPNIQKRAFYSPTLKRSFHAKVCVRALRNMDKLGNIDHYILKQKNQNLSARMMKIKSRIIKAIHKNSPKKKGALSPSVSSGSHKELKS